jgi:type VI secretion system secreted protein Hcp
MAIDLFLKLDGIPGESKDAKHPNEIVLDSFSWGEHNTPPATGGGAGKVSMQDFHFAARISKASPVLMLRCADGKHIPNALFTARKPGEAPFEFLLYKFNDVIITSVQEGGDGELPLDQVSFAFSKITVQYKEQLPDGRPGQTTTFSWDLKANKAL